MRQQIPILFIIFAFIALCSSVACAAQEPYDIDLKDLRRPHQYELDLNELKRPPLYHTKEPIPQHKTKHSTPVTTESEKETSNYTVKPGDHLFLILMQHYGLSNEDAERLIPEIVRLNGIQKAERLSVGQRITIPLHHKTGAASQKRIQEPPKPPPSEINSEEPRLKDTPEVREIVAKPAQPCLLTREVAEQLGVSISALSTFLGAESISLYHENIKVAVVCGLAPAEAYTVGRMLALQGVKLLAFKTDEEPRNVVEALAAGLGIPFSLSTSESSSELPLTYLFPGASAGKDLILTISAPIPSPKEP